MLKLNGQVVKAELPEPAAFGRLCVETIELELIDDFGMPAAFGRLCVETSVSGSVLGRCIPAAFGRLCVETMSLPKAMNTRAPSRLRAAVC